jgi:hypothetical protein
MPQVERDGNYLVAKVFCVAATSFATLLLQANLGDFCSGLAFEIDMVIIALGMAIASKILACKVVDTAERSADLPESRYFSRNMGNFVILLECVLPSLRVHSQANPASASGGPAIKANAEEVSLDLVVRDKKGRPVNDLRPET